MRLSRLFPILPFAIIPLFAVAASFRDVPATYPHREAIEKLTDREVISGHPDGTFRPYDPVDRASILKMLYKTAGLTVDGTKKNCFPDVAKDSWYEGFVCDAVSRGFVQGYDSPEGRSFKPGRPVSRVEALKLAIVILGIPEGTAAANLYSDVKSTDWFFPYVRTALTEKILPVSGQTGPQLSPHSLLERGEAAAYIWNALSAKVGETEEDSQEDIQSSSAPGTPASSSGDSITDAERRRQEQSEKDALAEDERNSRNVNFPFTDSAVFSGKHSLSFNFTVGSKQTADIVAALTSGNTGKLSCRLYRMKSNGFSTEYYLGFEEARSCYLRTTLAAGDYQLQLFPTVADQSVSVASSVTAGDGNDGFADAKLLTIGKARVEFLDANDLTDWYTFKITHSTSNTDIPGQHRTVQVVSSDNVGCLIYPMDDVDLFGFAGPNCNESYLFPPGTYTVGIRHVAPRAAKQTYSLEVK